MENINRKYLKPEIKEIRVDNEISLQLESSPPGGPTESELLNTNNKFSSNPFYIDIA